MAATVDPFSFATAELSKEYVGSFPHPDVVFRYLENVSGKTGVELLLGFNNTVSIKGSWMSLGRARTFLTEFLAAYYSPESCCSRFDKNINEDLQGNNHRQQHPLPNEAARTRPEAISFRLHDSNCLYDEGGYFKTSSQSRSSEEQELETSVAIQAVGQTSHLAKPPEPLVMYSDLQLNPHPAAKNVPSLDNIERALKNMYTKNKFATSAAAKLIQAKKTSFTEIEAQEDYDTGIPYYSEDHVEASHIKCNSQYLSVGISQEKSTISRELDFVLKEKRYSMEVHGHMKRTDKDGGIKEVKNSLLACDKGEQQLGIHSSDDIAAVTVNVTHNGKSTHDGKNVMQCRDELFKEKVNTADFNTKSKEAGFLKISSDCGPTQDTIHVQEFVPVTDKLETDCAQNDSATFPKRFAGMEKKVTREEDKIKQRKTKEKTVKQKKSSDVKQVKTSNISRKMKRGRRPKLHSVSTEGKHYLCDICSFVTKNQCELQRHKQKSHPCKEYKCEECGRLFSCGKNLKRHLVSHRGVENACGTCGKMYKSHRSLAAHLKTHAEDYVKPEFPCEFCSKVFSTKYVLAQHIKADHLGMKPTFFCPVCGKSFTQKHSYLEHANIHLGVKPYQCEVCGKSFSYDQALKEHKYMHDETKRFECLVCHKKFRQRRALSIHVKIHSEHKDYVCSTCGKGFSQKQAMIRHERVHTGQTPFLCAACGRSFADSSVLRRHMIFVHKKNPRMSAKHQQEIENEANFSVKQIQEIQKSMTHQLASFGTQGNYQKLS